MKLELLSLVRTLPELRQRDAVAVDIPDFAGVFGEVDPHTGPVKSGAIRGAEDADIAETAEMTPDEVADLAQDEIDEEWPGNEPPSEDTVAVERPDLADADQVAVIEAPRDPAKVLDTVSPGDLAEGDEAPDRRPDPAPAAVPVAIHRVTAAPVSPVATAQDRPLKPKADLPRTTEATVDRATHAQRAGASSGVAPTPRRIEERTVPDLPAAQRAAAGPGQDAYRGTPRLDHEPEPALPTPDARSRMTVQPAFADATPSPLQDPRTPTRTTPHGLAASRKPLADQNDQGNPAENISKARRPVDPQASFQRGATPRRQSDADAISHPARPPVEQVARPKGHVKGSMQRAVRQTAIERPPALLRDITARQHPVAAEVGRSNHRETSSDEVDLAPDDSLAEPSARRPGREADQVAPKIRQDAKPLPTAAGGKPSVVEVPVASADGRQDHAAEPPGPRVMSERGADLRSAPAAGRTGRPERGREERADARGPNVHVPPRTSSSPAQRLMPLPTHAKAVPVIDFDEQGADKANTAAPAPLTLRRPDLPALQNTPVEPRRTDMSLAQPVPVSKGARGLSVRFERAPSSDQITGLDVRNTPPDQGTDIRIGPVDQTVASAKRRIVAPLAEAIKPGDKPGLGSAGSTARAIPPARPNGKAYTLPNVRVLGQPTTHVHTRDVVPSPTRELGRSDAVTRLAEAKTPRPVIRPDVTTNPPTEPRRSDAIQRPAPEPKAGANAVPDTVLADDPAAVPHDLRAIQRSKLGVVTSPGTARPQVEDRGAARTHLEINAGDDRQDSHFGGSVSVPGPADAEEGVADQGRRQQPDVKPMPTEFPRMSVDTAPPPTKIDRAAPAKPKAEPFAQSEPWMRPPERVRRVERGERSVARPGGNEVMRQNHRPAVGPSRAILPEAVSSGPKPRKHVDPVGRVESAAVQPTDVPDEIKVRIRQGPDSVPVETQAPARAGDRRDNPLPAAEPFAGPPLGRAPDRQGDLPRDRIPKPLTANIAQVAVAALPSSGAFPPREASGQVGTAEPAASPQPAPAGLGLASADPMEWAEPAPARQVPVGADPMARTEPPALAAPVVGPASDLAAGAAASEGLNPDSPPEELGATPAEPEQPRTLAADAPRAASQRHEAPQTVRQVVDAIRRSDGSGYEITLQPEELGRLRMQVRTDGHHVVVHFAADRPETIDLLRRHAASLEAEYRNLGFENASFQFGGQAGGRRDATPLREFETTARVDMAEAPQVVPAMPPQGTPGATGLDLRI